MTDLRGDRSRGQLSTDGRVSQRGRGQVGRVSSDASVFDAVNDLVGSVDANGDLHDRNGNVIGRVDPSGKSFLGAHYVGIARGSSPLHGGAAIAFLLEPLEEHQWEPPELSCAGWSAVLAISGGVLFGLVMLAAFAAILIAFTSLIWGVIALLTWAATAWLIRRLKTAPASSTPDPVSYSRPYPFGVLALTPALLWGSISTAVLAGTVSPDSFNGTLLFCLPSFIVGVILSAVVFRRVLTRGLQTTTAAAQPSPAAPAANDTALDWTAWDQRASYPASLHAPTACLPLQLPSLRTRRHPPPPAR